MFFGLGIAELVYGVANTALVNRPTPGMNVCVEVLQYTKQRDSMGRPEWILADLI